METKKCEFCERELPMESYRNIRGGHFVNTCKECESLKRNEIREQKRAEKERQRNAYIAEFEGKAPVDVLQLMGRAKRWLEARGYEIVLKGSLMVKKEVKFE